MKENFISKDVEEDYGARVTAIDANKTLIIDQYTQNAGDEPELFEGAKTMRDVFDHFNPSVDVEFETAEGESVSETLRFTEMKDFDVNGGKGNLVSNSQFLSDTKGHIDNAIRIGKQIQSNSKLKSILKDPAARGELRALLQGMLDELEAAH